jgi:hypothetical protein
MKYGSCKHGGNMNSCPECNDISCDSKINKMEENKILPLVPRKKYKVDWEKVKTIDDLLLVMSTLEITFPGEPQNIKHLIKEKP